VEQRVGEVVGRTKWFSAADMGEEEKNDRRNLKYEATPNERASQIQVVDFYWVDSVHTFYEMGTKLELAPRPIVGRNSKNSYSGFYYAGVSSRWERRGGRISIET